MLLLIFYRTIVCIITIHFFFYVLQYILFIISAGLGAWSDFSFLSLANHMPDQQIQNLNLTASVIHFYNRPCLDFPPRQ